MSEKQKSVKAHLLKHTWRVIIKGKKLPSKYQNLNGTGAKQKSGSCSWPWGGREITATEV